MKKIAILMLLSLFSSAAFAGTELVKVVPPAFTAPAIKIYKEVQHLPRFPIGGRLDKLAQLNGVSPCDLNKMMAELNMLGTDVPSERLRGYLIRACRDDGREIIGTGVLPGEAAESGT